MPEIALGTVLVDKFRVEHPLPNSAPWEADAGEP
jgi:hypothetical protein